MYTRSVLPVETHNELSTNYGLCVETNGMTIFCVRYYLLFIS